MATQITTYRSCPHDGDSACSPSHEGTASCGDYLSWPEHWAREIHLIERALRNTYIAAALFVALAAATLLLPTAF